MDDKKLQERVPSLEQMNKTSSNLTQGFDDRESEITGDERSSFDKKGAGRGRGVDDQKPAE
ncbi:MAG: hypothetical protein KF760_33770 [Candidatus Eremiobacteraeota bacterium]|nr:hypothetical protein [Candidatus Eremiobacteraeota bacterium]MCW5869871.1 hypothetical protein [Candidatus Eremiobacteraeota bacterium]